MQHCQAVGNILGGRCPRKREALRGQRRVDLRLDLGIQIRDDAGNAILAKVVLHPTDDDVIGEVGVRDVWRSRVDGRLLDALIAGGVARAVVSDDGVEHGGDGIGMALVLWVSDEVGCGPSVGVGHKNCWLVAVDRNLDDSSV